MKNDRKGKRIAGYILCYGLAAILLAFYLFTLYQGMNPRPSPEYEAFYLNDEVILWPGEDALEIVRGQPVHFDSKTGAQGQGAGHIPAVQSGKYLFPDGWGYEEAVEEYCITSWQATLVFYGEPGQTYHGSISFRAPQPGGEITIFANEEQVAFELFPEEEKTVSFDTPALPEDGRLLLRIVLGGDLATPLEVKELVLE